MFMDVYSVNSSSEASNSSRTRRDSSETNRDSSASYRFKKIMISFVVTQYSMIDKLSENALVVDLGGNIIVD